MFKRSVVLVFYFMNARLFDIGIFLWFMIEATSIFFVPDWPVGVLNDIKPNFSYGRTVLLLGLLVGILVGGFLPERFGLVQVLIGGLSVAVTVYHIYDPFRRQLGAGNASNASRSRTERLHPRFPG